MASWPNIVDGLILSSQDYSNAKKAALKREPSAKFYFQQVEHHPAKLFISPMWLFSYRWQTRRVAFPERTLHENAIHAIWDVKKTLDEIRATSF